MHQSENGPMQGKGRRTPKWALEPFEYLINEVAYLQEFVYISRRGISVLRAMPQVEKALNKSSEHESKSRLDTERMAELAQEELERGFPVLHSQAVVSIWGFLEATITAFLLAWLQNEPKAFEAVAIQRLKIRLGDYHRLDGYERAEYVLNLLESDLVVGLRRGVARFEELLKPFGLSGDVPDEIRRSIYEMSQVRNVIAHRAGVVDHRFRHACPWINSQIGERLYVSYEMLEKYYEAALLYITRLVCRVSEYFEVDMSEHRAALQESESRHKEKYGRPGA